MGDQVYLIGAEDVDRAGRRMAEAASTMEHAASEIAGALERHQRFMDDWLERFRATLEDEENTIVVAEMGPPAR